MKARHTMSPEEQEAAFKTLAQKYFGPADPQTLAFRQRCKELGVGVVFYPSSMSYDEVIKILESEETQRILKDPNNW